MTVGELIVALQAMPQDVPAVTYESDGYRALAGSIDEVRVTRINEVQKGGYYSKTLLWEDGDKEDYGKWEDAVLLE